MVPWRQEAHELYGMLPPRLHLVVISHDQASRAPRGIRHAGVVHNGIAVEHYPLRSQPRGTQGYLCFIGRASQDKGPATAIRIARRLGRHLKMMIKISERDVCGPRGGSSGVPRRFRTRSAVPGRQNPR